MGETGSTDYQLNPAFVPDLMLASLAPAPVRRAILMAALRDHGHAAFVEAFAEFIGLANSVVENQRELLEIVAITEHGMHPHDAEKMNMPTVYGALNGVVLAEGIDAAKTCEGCAYRLGTCANQSPTTTIDAFDCAEPGEVAFMCHMDLDEKGEPTKGCAGFAQLRAKRKVAA